jgi:hypothetical protein
MRFLVWSSVVRQTRFETRSHTPHFHPLRLVVDLSLTPAKRPSSSSSCVCAIIPSPPFGTVGAFLLFHQALLSSEPCLFASSCDPAVGPATHHLYPASAFERRHSGSVRLQPLCDLPRPERVLVFSFSSTSRTRPSRRLTDSLPTRTSTLRLPA